MAEYVSKNGLIKFLDNLQQPKRPITEGFTCITIDDAKKVVWERPPADVVEREKIDKAIEEMEGEIINFTYNENKTLGASYGLRKAIDILRKNIEE